MTGDFTAEEYVRLQRVVYRVGEAIRRIVPTERLYILSLGSQVGNSHAHWHLAPLPPGVPFEEQQLAAIDTSEVVELTAWGRTGCKLSRVPPGLAGYGPVPGTGTWPRTTKGRRTPALRVQR